ncbi:hypothetical protein [Lentzea jiangxiensis]|uniref:Uncharacterized protein n=1 Tax=Lentzea jiangxiensis TaxID=641025 RepID=A0A1H0WRW2_9PSEU|nr:hypothetical protein [Lentzea jiangxiensis]SDP93454.1 hypothetical protein SAMN05421507_12212 [Lentzea jiangxiensis]
MTGVWSHCPMPEDEGTGTNQPLDTTKLARIRHRWQQKERPITHMRSSLTDAATGEGFAHGRQNAFRKLSNTRSQRFSHCFNHLQTA